MTRLQYNTTQHGGSLLGYNMVDERTRSTMYCTVDRLGGKSGIAQKVRTGVTNEAVRMKFLVQILQ